MGSLPLHILGCVNIEVSDSPRVRRLSPQQQPALMAWVKRRGHLCKPAFPVVLFMTEIYLLCVVGR